MNFFFCLFQYRRLLVTRKRQVVSSSMIVTNLATKASLVKRKVRATTTHARIPNLFYFKPVVEDEENDGNQPESGSTLIKEDEDELHFIAEEDGEVQMLSFW